MVVIVLYWDGTCLVSTCNQFAPDLIALAAVLRSLLINNTLITFILGNGSNMHESI